MKHLSAPLAILVLAGAAGCADPSRVDALEATLARVRAEGQLRDRKIDWLYWNQMNLTARAPDERAALARIAALEAENAALLQRLARAERRLEAPGRDGGHPQTPGGTPETPPRRPAPTRILDEQIPYELAVHRSDGSTPPADHVPPARRTLDERVPY